MLKATRPKPDNEEKKQDEKESKEKEILKLFQVTGKDIVLVEIQEDFGSGHSYPATRFLLDRYQSLQRTIILDD